MTHEFEVQVTRPMIQKAWKAWFWKWTRWRKLVSGMGLLGCSIALDVSSGRAGNVTVICLTVLGMGFCLYAGVYFLGRKRAVEKLDLIDQGKAHYTLSQETIQARSSLGSLNLSWTAVKEVRRYEDLVLLGFQGTAYSTLPAGQLPPEALAFLLERAGTSGAKITGFSAGTGEQAH